MNHRGLEGLYFVRGMEIFYFASEFDNFADPPMRRPHLGTAYRGFQKKIRASQLVLPCIFSLFGFVAFVNTKITGASSCCSQSQKSERGTALLATLQLHLVFSLRKSVL